MTPRRIGGILIDPRLWFPLATVFIGTTDTIAGWALRAIVAAPLYWAGAIDYATAESFILLR